MECVSSKLCRTLLYIFVAPFLLSVISADKDYYKLLGLSKDASNREIRQAFKKMALTMHPDKNPNNQNAHEKFLEINRAYEVLKDEDLRKKYDKYGEKGLQDSYQGGQYESWSFYRYDFGIYDDDPEIITLDRGDFDAAVDSGELWFVNFYFPRCSHCHDLAPMWREFSKEMDGVLKIGAVNCGDNNRLCRSKGVSSYPSLYMFKAGMNAQKYFGDRSKEGLMKFAMQFVLSKVTELWHGNIHTEMEKSQVSGVGWLLTFCTNSRDCLGSQTRQKLAGMLDGLVHVGWVDCFTQAELCTSLNVETSFTAYFPPGVSLSQRDGALVIMSLDAREIYREVMQHLPDLEAVTWDTFSKLANHHWLLSFTFEHKDQASSEYKKLKPLLREVHVRVGRVDCLAEAQLCKSLYIHKPSIAVFRGIDDFEVYHGKYLLYTIVAFAKESVSSHVTTLRPENFPHNKKEPWLVDFFVPWCPPCRALLPELRKASIELFGQLKFGTLDCTMHDALCTMYNIQAYPTTVIFNQSKTHHYEGHHSASSILEFIEDLVNPVVEVLTPDSFQQLVLQRQPNETWVLDFFAPWCGPCQALLPEWRRLARLVLGLVRVGTVDCQKYHFFCQGQNVRAYPELRIFPQEAPWPESYQSYNGWHRDAHSLRSWALGFLPRVSVDLSPEDFRTQVLQGQEHWVLDFYAPWCGPCQHFAPEFEFLAQLVKGTVRAGKLDCQAYGQTCQAAGIRAYPTVRFYPYLDATKRDQGGEHVNSRDASTIAAMLSQRLQALSPQLQGTAKLKDEL
ncbi:dnaJ homolog subfamily C member 10-like isoform X2 [Brienomyrus brachyistius]|uniref:dnaJ homolog subfamily C member 10-like isoform X2 n=1 Tax=Brienomyrus brachyistius TaxID=42636 RepID=UPI0020B3804B|nr:dnaJ homolog subfamily C member 10-like isoform X2 [Brienomyrus brachyistius]